VFKSEGDGSTTKLSPSKSHSMYVKRNLLIQSTPAIKQYGSLVTGLALESSDMDMAVTNLSLPDREKMIESLDLFAERLRKWEMIEDLNAISTASVPVIKATVDLNRLRETEMRSQNQDKLTHAPADFGQT
jgi:poly(A) polymerase Pap1